MLFSFVCRHFFALAPQIKSYMHVVKAENCLATGSSARAVTFSAGVHVVGWGAILG